jgi:hypothetical protein
MAFDGCTSIQTVDFKIASGATFTTGGYAFNECTNLETIQLSGASKTIDTLGGSTFSGCTKLTGFATSGVTITTLDGDGAFWGCKNLTYERIKTNLTIGNCA